MRDEGFAFGGGVVFFDDKGGAPKIGKQFGMPVFGRAFVREEGGFLPLQRISLAVIHRLDRGGGLAELLADGVLLLLKEGAETFALFLVPLFQFGTGGLVVSLDGGEGVVGKTPGNQLGRGAEETVATADVVIEETEGLAGIDGLEPQGNAAKLDGHGIDIDAV